MVVIGIWTVARGRWNMKKWDSRVNCVNVNSQSVVVFGVVLIEQIIGTRWRHIIPPLPTLHITVPEPAMCLSSKPLHIIWFFKLCLFHKIRVLLDGFDYLTGFNFKQYWLITDVETRWFRANFCGTDSLKQKQNMLVFIHEQNYRI